LDWITFLGEAGILSEGSLERIRNPFARFRQDGGSHDRFVKAANRAYANELVGISSRKLTSALPEFIEQDRKRFYPWAHEFFELLNRHDLTPAVVSGAPVEILQGHLAKLDATIAFGLVLGTDRGEFTGHIVCNPGLSDSKRRIAKALAAAGNELLLGVGDSPADKPLLEASQIRVVVGKNDCGINPAPERIDQNSAPGVLSRIDRFLGSSTSA
jgi:phosphoserine phosphatase